MLNKSLGRPRLKKKPASKSKALPSERDKLNQLKSDFVATVSHELRTPMAIIREGVSQVRDGITGPVSEEQRKVLGIVVDGMDRLERLIDDLLDAAKIEEGKMALDWESINLADLAEDVCFTFEDAVKKKGLELKRDFSRDGSSVFGDRDRLIQIMTNLIANALKFTSCGLIEVAIKSHPREIECSVTDTGSGIAEQDLPRVFEKFEHFGKTGGREKGTGLGLAISKGIAELHHGRIQVQSTAGKGSAFAFFLPRYTPEAFIRECLKKILERPSASGSFGVYRIENYDAASAAIGAKEMDSLVHEMSVLITSQLRRRFDLSLRDKDKVWILLPGAVRDQRLKIVSRLDSVLKDFLDIKALKRRIGIASTFLHFPEDGKTAEELLGKITR